MPLLDYDDDQEDIMARRAAEREKNKNAKRHADLELNDIARRMLSTSEAGASFASVTRNHSPSYATADGPPIGEVYLLGPGSPSSPY